MDHIHGRTLAALLSLCVLGACSSSDGGGESYADSPEGDAAAIGEESGTPSENPATTPETPISELSELAGVWDLSAGVEYENGSETWDENYIAIGADGSYAAYDYMGDSEAFDPQNCYERSAGTLTPTGDRTFTLEVITELGPWEREGVQYWIDNGMLTMPLNMTDPSRGTASFPRSEIDETTMLSMLCED